MKKLICLILAVCLLCSCTNTTIEPTVTDTTTTTTLPTTEAPTPTTVIEAEETLLGDFLGSYLTMRLSQNPLPHELPHLEVFTSYSEVESYFNFNVNHYFMGQKFTMSCYSFNDEYLANCDIVMLVIEEQSAYISHKSDVIRIKNGVATFNLERHIPETAPEREGAVYHLVYSVPKGSFDGVDCENVVVNITEVLDEQNTDVFDAERFRYIYPEFWPYVQNASALVEAPSPNISVIHTYDEILSFYQSNKNTFNLDEEFLRFIGSIYNERHFEDYVLILAILPFDKTKPKPVVSELFLYNLQVFLTIDNLPQEVPNENVQWRIVEISVVKSDLDGINLREINIAS
ncbi:MAG: hypothetical protein IKU89_02705 [Oscillospiraceae bacterium]|nr:hypothetical protein [Oscillospiraceae bacterium]